MFSADFSGADFSENFFELDWSGTDVFLKINVDFDCDFQKSIWSCFNKLIIDYFDQMKFIHTVKKLNQKFHE